MYVYKLLTIIGLTAMILGFTQCIGTQSQLVWNAPQEIAGGEEAFEKTVYPLTRANCINCHTTQSPTHAADDVHEAYVAALPKMNFNNIPNSRLVQKLRSDQHNCWGDCAANADEMEAAIEELYDMIKTTDAESPNPVINPPPTSPTAQILKTTETMSIERELANMANPLKSNTVAINAGSAMVNAPMVKATDTYGDFIYVPNDGSNQTLANNDGSAGVAMINIKLPAAGNYFIYGYALAPNANDNSFYAGIAPTTNPTAYIGGLRQWDFTANGNPAWNKLNSGINVTAAGNYTLTLRERKDGTQIYRIFVTSDPGFDMNDVAAFIGVTLSFDISAITKVPGSKFVVDVSDYDMYTYLVSRPRIVTPSQNIRVKNVRLFVNNAYSPQNSTYTTVDKVTTPTDGLLSGFPMIVLKEKGSAIDTFHFEFEILEGYSGTVNNKSLVAFQNSVYQISRTNCASCHSGQYPHASPDPLTAHDYVLNSRLVDFNNPSNSFIANKIRGGHKTFNATQGAALATQYEQAIIQWRTDRGSSTIP